MAYTKTNFKDRIDTKPTTYIVDGKPTIIEKDNSGLVQEGTPLNAELFNKMEETILLNLKNIEEIQNNYNNAKKVTYTELTKLIAKEMLITGNNYILVDYATKYRQPTTNIIKTMEKEPLLITANSPTTITPIVYSCKYPQDIIWYDINNCKCEDNSTTRNGFIIRRIDTVNKNDCPADFRSILWARYLPDKEQYYLDGNLTNYEVWTSGNAKTGVIYKSNTCLLMAKNTTVPKNATDTNVFFKLIDDITKDTNAIFTKDKTKIYKNIEIKKGELKERFTFGDSCTYNIISSCNNIYNNSFGNNCYNNSFNNSCDNNSFGDNCHNNSFGNSCGNNSFGDDCGNNSFNNSCDNNSFGNYCHNNSFGNSCDNNSFNNSCYNNSFGNDCDSNSFGNSCDNNSFNNNCGNNSFGDDCGNNSFNNSCDNNSFGDNCHNNSFGNSCDNNSFGNDCYNNSFGNYCHNNSFGNSCDNNSFNNNCGNNSFGNDCDNNSFNNNCGNNSFGNSCHNLVIKEIINKKIQNISLLTNSKYIIYIEYEISRQQYFAYNFKNGYINIVCYIP